MSKSKFQIDGPAVMGLKRLKFDITFISFEFDSPSVHHFV